MFIGDWMGRGAMYWPEHTAVVDVARVTVVVRWWTASMCGGCSVVPAADRRRPFEPKVTGRCFQTYMFGELG